MSDSRRKRKSSSVDSDISQEVKVALKFNQLSKISLILIFSLQTATKGKRKRSSKGSQEGIDTFFIFINFAQLPKKKKKKITEELLSSVT